MCAVAIGAGVVEAEACVGTLPLHHRTRSRLAHAVQGLRHTAAVHQLQADLTLHLHRLTGSLFCPEVVEFRGSPTNLPPQFTHVRGHIYCLT